VTARGNAQEDIYCDDGNCQQSLMLLLNTVNRYNWFCHAYCLMDNHYHQLIEISVPALSKEMKFLNGTFTQYLIDDIDVLVMFFRADLKPYWCRKMLYYFESSERADGSHIKGVAVEHIAHIRIS